MSVPLLPAMKKTFTAMLSLCYFLAQSQAPMLLPSLGLSSEPLPTDTICTIPTYLGNYEASGIQEGDTCADFTLYNANGAAFNLQSTLAAGRPVLMISGSYTCPVFRNKIEVINQVIQDYGADLEVIVIYGVEAHPFGDISPYFGYENPGQANLNSGILFAQPTTYQERVALGDTLFANSSIDPNIVFFEGPCQNWWNFYGPAPQNSYFVDTTGVVYSKHGWFDKFPHDINCDIESYFNLPQTNCSGDFLGTFELENLDTFEFGAAGDILYPGTDMVNNSLEDVLVEVRRMNVDVPADWETSMCITACLIAETSIDTVLIPDGATQPFTIDFHTSEIPADGRVRMRFRNVYDPQNQYIQPFYAYTSPLGIHETTAQPFSIYPNPTSGEINIPDYPNANNLKLVVYNAEGKLIQRLESTNSKFELGAPNGLYFLELFKDNERVGTSKVMITGN